MPSGIGEAFRGAESSGKHMARPNGDYPDSWCGSGQNITHDYIQVTCPSCIARLQVWAHKILAYFGG